MKIQGQETTCVEVSPLDKSQIEDFVKSFFVPVPRQAQKDWLSRAISFFDCEKNRALAKAKRLLFQLNLPQNQLIRELAGTPILLWLTCLVFEEQDELPTNRAALYKAGLEILLSTWDEQKGNQRGEIYRNLSLKQKQELLSQLAKITWEDNRYFFNQKEIEREIADYLCTLPDTQNHVIEERCISKDVLKSIELQHGLLVKRERQIYSFSHQTFQEYFAARAFVESSKPHDLENLASHILEKRWREVFLWAAGIVPIAKANELLLSIKNQVDILLNSERELQKFLAWSNQKSQSLEAPYKPVAVRAFYQFLALTFKSANDYHNQDYLNFARNFDRNFSITPSLSSDLALARVLLHAQKIIRMIETKSHLDSYSQASYSLKLSIEQATENIASELGSDHHPVGRLVFLSLYKDKLPSVEGNLESLRKWWKDKGLNWTRRLREVMIEDYNLIDNWQFTSQQEKLLQKYYTANKILMDCLNIVSERLYSEKLQEIEDTLLLPITEIEKKQQPNSGK